jgi:hypothetical protein
MSVCVYDSRAPAPSNASIRKMFLANSWTAYRPGDDRLMRARSGVAASPPTVISTCIQ